MPDLHKQLAEMPCPHCDGTGGELLSVCCGAPEFCDVEGLCGSCRDWTGFSRCEECNETGLRWLTLSELCDLCHGTLTYITYYCYKPGGGGVHNCNQFGNAHPICYTCNGCRGSGRVPDVTLEKVLEEAYKIGGVILSRNGDAKWCCSILGTDAFVMEFTSLDAACAALLASG